MKAICISASNIINSGSESNSYQFCNKVKNVLDATGTLCEIIDLREYDLSPCIGCGNCFVSKRWKNGGSDWALASYKAMVNDTIANALDTIQFRIVPYNDGWNTGISIAVHNVEDNNGIFPIQKYDQNAIEEKIQKYVAKVIQEI